MPVAGEASKSVVKILLVEWKCLQLRESQPEVSSHAPPLYVLEETLSRVQLFATPWTTACWAPPSIGFSRQEYYVHGVKVVFTCVSGLSSL